MASDIFLSYASLDRDRVRPLVERLQENGWSVWWDRDIPKGKDYSDVIVGAIESSRTMVVVWSAASVSSNWVRGEARMGLKNGRGLFPVRLDTSEPPIDFQSLQETDLTDWDGSSSHSDLEALIEALTEALAVPHLGLDRALGATSRRRAADEPDTGSARQTSRRRARNVASNPLPARLQAAAVGGLLGSGLGTGLALALGGGLAATESLLAVGFGSLGGVIAYGHRLAVGLAVGLSGVFVVIGWVGGFSVTTVALAPAVGGVLGALLGRASTRYRTGPHRDTKHSNELMRGQRRPASMLFSDLAGFSSSQELGEPEKLIEILTEYLDAMTQVVIDTGGSFFYIGDAIMAHWNATSEVEDHADRALHAMVYFQREMVALRERMSGTHEDYEHLEQRIGVHTGEVLVGKAGTHSTGLTLIGNAVNLAARLEPANKTYGTLSICSETTLNAASTAYRVRKLDWMVFKGQEQPVGIFEVLELAGVALSSEKEQALAAYDLGMKAYLRHDWETALGHFQVAVQSCPDDGPSQLYIQRCVENIGDPPPADWDFVTRLRMM